MASDGGLYWRRCCCRIVAGSSVKGFLAGRDHYAFIVWRNKKGEVSKPSKPFKFMLKDEFAEK